MRVATFFQHQQTLARIQQSTSNLDRVSGQITSGFKADRFEDQADVSTQLFNLQELRNSNESFISGLKVADSRLRTMEDALNSMTDLLTEATRVATLGRNELSPDVRATIAPQAQGLADTFFQLLNTQFEGRYVFSGQGSETAPISASLSANPFPGDPPPTTYYNGDAERAQVVTGPGTSQGYGVTGDNLGFARIKSGLEALIYGLQNDSLPDLDGAMDSIAQAQKDVSDMLGRIGGEMSGFELLTDRFDATNDFMTERIDELSKVDLAEASTRFAQEETALNASLSITSRILNLSLLNFLR